MGTHARAGVRRASAARIAVAGALVVAVTAVVVGIGAAQSGQEASAAPATVDRTAPAAAGRSPAPAAAPKPAPGQPAPAQSSSARSAPASAAPAARPQAAPSTTAPSTTAARAGTPTRTATSGSSSVAPIVQPGPERVSGTPCTPTARACVDLSAGMAWLIDNGRVARGPVRVAAGDNETPTPRGTFVVQWKAEQYTSRQYLTQMPYSVFFADGGIAFHEGRQDTHSGGCVKLVHDDAVAWFNFLQVGNEVQIH